MAMVARYFDLVREMKDAYNLASELTSITYPSGRVLAQTFDNIGRLSQITSSSVNYLTVASSSGYNAANEVLSATYGNGVAATFTYNARLQLASLAYAKAGANLFSLAYNYGTGNNGQIQSITDNVDNGRTVNYTYDAWSRLKTAATVGSTAYPAWGLSWSYDRYGNRKQQTVTAGTNMPSNSVAINPLTNRITDTGYAYDLAGNMTNDGANTLTYDAENRVTNSVNGGASGAYVFDGNSLRVKKTVSGATTVYIFSGTKVIAEYASGAAPSSPSKEYIYAGSQLLATLTGPPASATANYHIADHLSPRVTTDSTGTVVGQQAHFPFGEDWYASNSTTKFKFTSYERDSESGNDYAMMRTSINRLGRFSSPDRLAGSLINPQSLNRYAYVTNDSVNLIDPIGLSARPRVTCLIDSLQVPCMSLYALLRMGAGDMIRSLLGPEWVTSGGDYRGRGCYTNRVTDEVWCPGNDTSQFEMGDLSFLDDLTEDPPVSPCETRGGRRYGPGHRANDYHAPTYGTQVRVAGPGVVIATASGKPHVPEPYNLSLRPPPTNSVRVWLDNGYTVGYAHVTPSVSIGDQIPRGGTIGTVDSSGRTTAPHVHVEVRDPLGDPVDPNRFFKDCI